MGATDDQLIAWATRMLAGVGDAGAGEWVQVNAAVNGIRVCHLRRRLAKPEARRIGDVRDVRERRNICGAASSRRRRRECR